MIIAMMAVYLVLLFAIVQLGIVRFNLFWKASPLIVLLLLNIGLFIPMGWGAPQGTALVARFGSHRAKRRGRGHRGAGRCEYAIEGRRYPVPDRSRSL
jgi:hypothetical protein